MNNVSRVDTYGKGVSHLEVGTIEGTFWIDDHEADDPFEEGTIIELLMTVSIHSVNFVERQSRTSILTHFSFSNPLYSLIKRCFAPADIFAVELFSCVEVGKDRNSDRN